MITKTTELSSILDELERAGGVPDADQMNRVARALAKCFSVESDEVAVLALHAKQQALRFVLPQLLSPVGTIPLTSNVAVVSRTVRERRSEVINNLGTARHLSVFEGVPLGRRDGEYIQKIMSAPILEEQKVVGAVQISRKGTSPSSTGPDFTQKDLAALEALSPALNRFLKICKIG
jgi:hypothetical protein